MGTRRGCVWESIGEERAASGRLEKVLSSGRHRQTSACLNARPLVAHTSRNQVATIGTWNSGGEEPNGACVESSRAMSLLVIRSAAGNTACCGRGARCVTICFRRRLARQDSGRTGWICVPAARGRACERARTFLRTLSAISMPYAILFCLYPDAPPLVLRRKSAQTATIAPMKKNFCPSDSPLPTSLLICVAGTGAD